MASALPEMTAPELHNGTLREPIPPDLLGSAVLDREGAFEAGSHQSFTLTYTAGRFGIDDSGSRRVVFRFATEQSNPQLEDPAAPNFTEVTGRTLVDEPIVNKHFETLADLDAERCVALDKDRDLVKGPAGFHWWPERAYSI